jgi:hypothetical protein
MTQSLEPGAQLALHAMRRASMRDGTSCPVNTEKVIAAQLAMRAFAQILLEAGRKLHLAEVGELVPTPDERTMLNVLASAQIDDRENLIAALRWLLGREPSSGIIECARSAGAAFAVVGWIWGKPEVKRAPEPIYGMKAVRAIE